MSLSQINLQGVYSWQHQKDRILALRITNVPWNTKSIKWPEDVSFISIPDLDMNLKLETFSRTKNSYFMLYRNLKEYYEILLYF